jgi:Na+/melibiose symporter-like transporter
MTSSPDYNQNRNDPEFFPPATHSETALPEEMKNHKPPIFSGDGSPHTTPNNLPGEAANFEDFVSEEPADMRSGYIDWSQLKPQSKAEKAENKDKEVKTGSVLTNRNFMLLWIAQAFSQTAQNTLNLALVNFVYLLSGGSPTQTAIATVAFVLPGVFFSALAGVFVDRINKRRILIVTNILRAMIIPWLVFMGDIPLAYAIPLIFLITCLFSTFSQFFAPAEGAIIPFLVKQEQLTQANSLFQITLFASQFLGFSILAPLLPRWIGSQNLFWAIAVIYLLCVFLTWWLPNDLEKDMREPVESTRTLIGTIWHEIKEGWRFIRSNRAVWRAIVYLSTVQSVLFTMTAIGIPYVSNKSDGLGQEEGDIIFVLAPLSIGLGISVYLINKLITPRNRDKILVWATYAMGITVILVALLKPFSDLWVKIFTPGVPIGGPGLIFVLIGLSIPFGFWIGVLNIPALTILQDQSPKDIVGRVYAAYFTFANLVSIFPILFAGAMGDLIGLVPTLILIGLGVVAIGYYCHQDRLKSKLLAGQTK